MCRSFLYICAIFWITHMMRIFSILMMSGLLGCTFASLRVFSCVVTSNKCEQIMVKCCVSAKSCSMDVGNACASKLNERSTENDCNREPAQPSNCCFVCNPNCCRYLVPEMTYLVFYAALEDVVGKPHGLQHCHAQSFHAAIWHPPASMV